MADGLKLIVPNPSFKNYEIPIFDAETYGFLAKYEIKPIEKILHEMYLIPLQFVIENITEISEAMGFTDILRGVLKLMPNRWRPEPIKLRLYLAYQKVNSDSIG